MDHNTAVYGVDVSKAKLVVGQYGVPARKTPTKVAAASGPGSPGMD